MAVAFSFREPRSCTAAELRGFERLVRRGFRGSDETLPGRIRAARLLGLCDLQEDSPAAIAALKAPTASYREDVFRKASSRVLSTGYGLELGWVYVVPEHRGRRIARSLCSELLACVAGCPVFATTRPDNAPMIRILLALGFRRSGRPFPHPRRLEEIALYVLAGSESLA